jgi:hypothetical protein
MTSRRTHLIEQLHDLYEWILAVLTSSNSTSDDTQTGGQETPSSPGPTDGSGNGTNASQPPSRPDMETPTSPPGEDPRDTPPENDTITDDEDELELDMPAIPCVGDPKWSHAPPAPERPTNPLVVMDVKLWPEQGSPETREGCRMARDHFEYVVLDAWAHVGVDVTVTVADDAVPEYIKDRSGFKEYAMTRSQEPVAQHVNVHAGTDGPPGSACCGWGYVNVAGRFDGLEWTDEDCVKRRRGGSAARGVASIIHEGLHCVGISHEGEYAWLKEEKLWIGGQSHVSIMGTSYVNAAMHLMALHPDNDQVPEFLTDV